MQEQEPQGENILAAIKGLAIALMPWVIVIILQKKLGKEQFLG